jgi:hypothetical protein
MFNTLYTILRAVFLSLGFHLFLFLLGRVVALLCVVAAAGSATGRFVKHKFVLILCEELTRPCLVVKQRVDSLYVGHGDLGPLSLLADQVGHCNQIDSVPKEKKMIFFFFGI